MSATGLVLVVVGVVLIAVGLVRAREPWARYRALRARELNIERYEAWRGGLRETGPTGASVAMDLLRGRLRTDAAVAGLGVLLVVAGFVVG